MYFFQASIPNVLDKDDEDDRGEGTKDDNGILFEDLEDRLWMPNAKNALNDNDIDKFLIIARSVGTFAR